MIFTSHLRLAESIQLVVSRWHKDVILTPYFLALFSNLIWRQVYQTSNEVYWTLSLTVQIPVRQTFRLLTFHRTNELCRKMGVCFLFTLPSEVIDAFNANPKGKHSLYRHWKRKVNYLAAISSADVVCRVDILESTLIYENIIWSCPLYAGF